MKGVRLGSCLLVLVLSACGGTVSSTPESDAGDGSVTLDATPEASPDASPDASSDASPDASPDVSLPDAVPDTGTSLTAACAAAGGALCTHMRWDICPAGFEPVAGADAKLGCGNGGWCCAAAPKSTCSASGRANCVVGSCTGCWSKVADPSLSCEPGRSCCEDLCD